MASFAYKGVATSGRNVSGVVEADTAKSARARLRERGIFASQLREAEPAGDVALTTPLRRGLPARELARAMRQLATLISAGIPLVDAVRSLGQRPLRPVLRSALESVRSDLTGGESFHAACAKHPQVFPTIYVGMIRAGEASGALDHVLTSIADHAETNANLQAQLRTAMTYPIIMMLVGSAIVTFLLAYVVPQVTRVFLESGQILPVPTRVLMGLGRFVAAYGLYVLALLAIGALMLRSYVATARGRRWFERLLFRLPWIGSVVRNVVMARFAHTLGTMISGGMPLIEALDVSRGVVGSALVADELARSRQAVSEGEGLAENLSHSRLFHAMLVDMIAVGEKSGDLERMLARAGEALDEEVRNNVEIMTGALEPAMILIMAGVVLFVVLAVMLPVFEMNQLVR